MGEAVQAIAARTKLCPMAVGTEIGRSLRMAALFAEEPLPVASQGQRRTTVGACCRIPTFRALDQRLETADVEEKHRILALVVSLPKESHSGCEENPRRPQLLVQGSVLTPKNEGSRFVGRVLNHLSQRGVCRNTTRVQY